MEPVFAEDGACRVRHAAGGPGSVAEWVTGVLSGPRLRHIMGGDDRRRPHSATEAHGIADMVLLAVAEGSWVLAAAPRYVDRYVRTADGGRFAERILEDRPATA